MSQFVVAVDGPAGSGKSSVSKAAALALGYGYLDTGAGYRAFTWHAIENPGLTVEELAKNFDYVISTDPIKEKILLGGEDISGVIRTPTVAERVSEFARDHFVRRLQAQDAQQRIASCANAGIVVEGRDITTVVAPNAQLRVLLTASAETRLRRRGLEDTESAENLLERDESDSKVAEFMEPAEGVILLDTTHLDFDGSVRALISLIEASKSV